LAGKFAGDDTYRTIMKRKAVPRGKLLFEHSRHIKKEWDYLQNVDDPQKLTFASSKKVWWKCSKGHQWKQIIHVRTLQEHGCPYCSNKRVSNDNCLATVNPKLTAEWDRDKNDITPNEVTYGSGKDIWWKCEKGHSWMARVNDRSRGYGCPYCSGHRKWV
jgi:DNA-directed RNA polymerase subunit RPC12/RpoP